MDPECDCCLAAHLSTDRDGKQRQMFTKSSCGDHKLAVEMEQINGDYWLTVACLRTIETAPASELPAPSFHSYVALAWVCEFGFTAARCCLLLISFGQSLPLFHVFNHIAVTVTGCQLRSQMPWLFWAWRFLFVCLFVRFFHHCFTNFNLFLQKSRVLLWDL